MARLTASSLFRTDLAFARYCAHPWVAISHLALAAGTAVYLHQRPAPDLPSWALLALAIVPGVWLLSASLSYGMLLALKLVAPTAHPLRSGLPTGWRATLCRREALALAMVVALGHAGTEWGLARPIDNADFQHCAQSMGEAGWKALAATLTPGVSREKFWSLCAEARASEQPTPQPVPRTMMELQQRYGPSVVR